MGDVYMSAGLGEGWRRKRRKEVSSHRLCSSADMPEAPRAEPFNSQKEKPSHQTYLLQTMLPIKQLLCPPPNPSPSPTPPRPAVLPPCDIRAATAGDHRTLVLSCHQLSTVSGGAWYRPFYYPDVGWWVWGRGGDGVSIELPLADSRTNPANGEADGWLTTSIDWASLPASLPHLVHPFLIPAARFLLYHCRSTAPQGPSWTKPLVQFPVFVPSASFFFLSHSMIQIANVHETLNVLHRACSEWKYTQSALKATRKLCGVIVPVAETMWVSAHVAQR